MRVKYCTINGHFHPNKHSAGPGHFCRALQKFVFPKYFQNFFTFWTIARLQTIYEMSVESNHNCPVSFEYRSLKENISLRDAGLHQSKKGWKTLLTSYLKSGIMKCFISHSCPEWWQAMPSEALSITSPVGSHRGKFDSQVGLILLLSVTLEQVPWRAALPWYSLRICRGSAARACCYLGEAQERLDSGHSPVALFCYCLLWYLQKKSDSLHRTLSRSRFVWLQKMAFKASISHSIQNFSPSGLCLYRTQLSEEVSNTWNTSQDCLQSSYLACHVGLFRSCSCRNLYAQIT